MIFVRLVLILFLFIAFSACSVNKSINKNVVIDTNYYNKINYTNQKINKRVLSRTVVIDPGHGGSDLGAYSNVCEEKDLCLKTSLRLRHFLELYGYNVIMTRTTDEYVSLKKRVVISNLSKGQIFVSIHFNSAHNHTANGVEVFYYPNADQNRLHRSKQLAQLLMYKLIVYTGAKSRGIKKGNFCVIRETTIPSVLIEGGFITNDVERKLIQNNSYIDKIANAIAEGIHSYFNI